MKKCFSLFLIAALVTGTAAAQSPPVSVYTITVPLINGTDTLTMSAWQGKKILVVNTASQSAYAEQYVQLEQLYQQFKDSGLVILACPSNSFGAEPYSNQQVKNLCITPNGVTYSTSKKIFVNDSGAHPLYQWLSQKSQNGVVDTIIRSDFTKFLINGQGQLVGFFDGSISPLDIKVVEAIRAN